MSRRFVIVGTDTGVGKTIFSAGLVGALGAYYWKPVQAGLEEETDSQTVARLSGARAEQILPEARRLKLAASPHLAARAEGDEIDVAKLDPPACAGDLIIETSGGVMAPLTDRMPTIDLLALWGLPVIVVARTALGTINHSLLTIEALRRREIRIKGVAFVGDEARDVEATIAQMGSITRLGRLPRLDPLAPDSLRAAFASAFDVPNFRKAF